MIKFCPLVKIVQPRQWCTRWKKSNGYDSSGNLPTARDLDFWQNSPVTVVTGRSGRQPSASVTSLRMPRGPKLPKLMGLGKRRIITSLTKDSGITGHCSDTFAKFQFSDIHNSSLVTMSNALTQANHSSVTPCNSGTLYPYFTGVHLFCTGKLFNYLTCNFWPTSDKFCDTPLIWHTSINYLTRVHHLSDTSHELSDRGPLVIWHFPRIIWRHLPFIGTPFIFCANGTP